MKVERIIIAFLIVLLVVVFFIKDKPQNQNKFELRIVSEPGQYLRILRLNKETGQIHFIRGLKIVEVGTEWVKKPFNLSEDEEKEEP